VLQMCRSRLSVKSREGIDLAWREQRRQRSLRSGGRAGAKAIGPGTEKKTQSSVVHLLLKTSDYLLLLLLLFWY
jgi:hypothetical protein